MAIDTDGLVYSWGKGDNGRLGLGDATMKIVPTIVEKLRTHRVVHVSVGLSHSMVLTDDGQVFSFGQGEHGKLGHGTLTETRQPKLIEALKDVTVGHVCCGAYFSVVISTEGRVFSFGKNDQGQCGIGNKATISVLLPTAVDIGDYQASYCASGWEHTLLITTDGVLMSWGLGYEGHRPVLGHGDEKAQLKPKIVQALTPYKITHVACGWDHSLCVSEEGRLYSWGDGTHGRLGHNSSSHVATPKVVAGVQHEKLSCLFVESLVRSCFVVFYIFMFFLLIFD